MLGIDAHIWEKSAQKKSDLYLDWWPRKSRFPLNLTDTHTDGWIFVTLAIKKLDICVQ